MNNLDIKVRVTVIANLYLFSTDKLLRLRLIYTYDLSESNRLARGVDRTYLVNAPELIPNYEGLLFLDIKRLSTFHVLTQATREEIVCQVGKIGQG
jgi:hypothetical protein